MRHPALIDQRAAHKNETFLNKLIDKRGVLIPKWLLSRALRWIAIRTRRRNCQECIFHYGKPQTLAPCVNLLDRPRSEAQPFHAYDVSLLVVEPRWLR